MPAIDRCPWCGTKDQIYIDYHDQEWGVPELDSRALFEKLILDGFQAGLSWITILKRRESFRAAFDNFDPSLIARYDSAKIEHLMQDPGIIRNRAKVLGTIKGAQLWLEMEETGESFSEFIWSFTEGRTLQNNLRRGDPYPVTSPESIALSKALKKKGFTFCGPVIIYAFMQAIGMVNDHDTSCHRHATCKDLGR